MEGAPRRVSPHNSTGVRGPKDVMIGTNYDQELSDHEANNPANLLSMQLSSAGLLLDIHHVLPDDPVLRIQHESVCPTDVAATWTTPCKKNHSRSRRNLLVHLPNRSIKS